MNIIAEIIDSCPTSGRCLYRIDVFIDNALQGAMFADVNCEEQSIKFGRMEPYDYLENIREKANCLAIAYAFYNEYLTKPMQHGWIFSVENLYGWGVPFRQLHICAMQFMSEWSTLNAIEFRQRLQKELDKWNVELDIQNHEQYAYMMDAMCLNLYENRNIEYHLVYPERIVERLKEEQKIK